MKFTTLVKLKSKKQVFFSNNFLLLTVLLRIKDNTISIFVFYVVVIVPFAIVITIE